MIKRKILIKKNKKLLYGYIYYLNINKIYELKKKKRGKVKWKES